MDVDLLWKIDILGVVIVFFVLVNLLFYFIWLLFVYFSLIYLI